MQVRRCYMLWLMCWIVVSQSAYAAQVPIASADEYSPALSQPTQARSQTERRERSGRQLASADLRISVADAPDPVFAGDNLSYTVTVNNGGPDPLAPRTVTGTNPGRIVVPQGAPSTTLGPANPYPATIALSGIQGTIASMQVALNAVTHGFPDDLDLLLVGPQGQRLLLMSDAGGGTGLPDSGPVNSVNLVFDDAAPAPLPDTSQITAGSYRPTNYNTPDSLPAPAPAGPYAPNLAVFHGTNPNGTWQLFAVDDAPGETGQIGGWSLVITTMDQATVTTTLPPGVTYLSAGGPGWNCAQASSTVTCVRSTLPLGNAPPITIETIAPSTGGMITATASVSSNLGDPNPSNNSATQETFVIPIADLVLSKTVSPNPVRISERLTYTLSVANAGPSPALDLVVSDTLPAAATFVSASGPGWNCDWASATLTCSRPSAAVGATLPPISVVMIAPATGGTLSNTASVEASLTDSNPKNNTDTVVSTVAAVANLALSGSVAPSPLIAGGPVTYSLTVNNAGPNPATGVIITDTLASAVVITTLAPGCSQTANVVRCVIGTLASGSTASLSIAGRISAAATGTLSNTATVDANELDDLPQNNLLDLSRPLSRVSNLGLSAQLAPSPLVAGGPISYSLTVSNAGPSDASGVVITTTVALGVTLTSWPAGCALAGQIVRCALPTVAAGSSRTVLLAGVLDAAATGALNTTITVAGSAPDPVPANNTLALLTPIAQQSNLVLAGRFDPNPVRAGGVLTTTYNITNTGPSQATSVVITTTLPLELALLAVPASCQLQGNQLACFVGTLNVGAAATILITTRLAPSAVGILSQSAVVSSNHPDPDSPSNSLTLSAPVRVESDLAIQITAQPSPLAAGIAVSYTLDVLNQGPATATGVVVTATLPLGVTLGPLPTGCGFAPSAQVVQCSLGSLQPQTNLALRLSGTVNADAIGNLSASAGVTGQPSDPNPANNTSSITTAVTALSDLALTSMLAPQPLVAGAALSFTIGIANNGPALATGVVITTALPAALTPLAVSPSCTVLDQLLTCTLGTVAVGATPTLTLTAQISNAASGPLTLSATGRADQADPNPSNSITSVTSLISSQSDLAVLAITPSQPVVAGNPLSYTLTITNRGPSVATGVVITTTLPLAFAQLPAPCSNIAAAVRCVVGTLEPQAIHTLVLTGTLSPDAPATLSSTVTVGGDQPDPALTNNLLTLSTPVLAWSDLAAISTSAPEVVTSGDPLIYTLMISNNGPSQASAIVLTNTLPLGVSFGAAQPACRFTLATREVVCELASLAVGAQATFVINTTVTAPAGTSLINTVVVSTAALDRNPANNSAVSNTQILAPTPTATRTAGPTRTATPTRTRTPTTPTPILSRPSIYLPYLASTSAR